MSDKEHDFGSLVSIYSQVLPRIRKAAKELGYAIAIHGTMTRDLDLLAVPWVDSAAEPLALVKMIADEIDGYVIGDRTDERGYISDHPTEQPHGRLSWNICWGGKAFIDLSVMQRTVSHAELESLRSSLNTAEDILMKYRLSSSWMSEADVLCDQYFLAKEQSKPEPEPHPVVIDHSAHLGAVEKQ